MVKTSIFTPFVYLHNIEKQTKDRNGSVTISNITTNYSHCLVRQLFSLLFYIKHKGSVIQSIFCLKLNDANLENANIITKYTVRDLAVAKVAVRQSITRP